MKVNIRRVYAIFCLYHLTLYISILLVRSLFASALPRFELNVAILWVVQVILCQGESWASAFMVPSVNVINKYHIQI